MGKITDILEKFGISASNAQAEDFEKWIVDFTWSKYNEDKMNQRIIIENKVKSLGLRFSNGTVGKEYSAQFIIPNELVDDVWIEGFEELGLRASLKDDNNKSVNSDDKIEAGDITSCENDHTEAHDQNAAAQVATACQTEDFILEVKGRPTTPGDFTVNLCYKHKGWLDGEPVTEIKIPVAFNPDPRSLWKNIETPKDIIFYKPDYESEYLKVEGNETSGPRKDIVAASQRGRSHAQ